MLTLDVDLLIPAALENAVDEKIAKNIRADIISEAANGPLTPKADDVLKDTDVFVIPDILANAGGVTVSYFEWVQNRQRFYWSEERVIRRRRRGLRGIRRAEHAHRRVRRRPRAGHLELRRKRQLAVISRRRERPSRLHFYEKIGRIATPVAGISAIRYDLSRRAILEYSVRAILEYPIGPL